MRIYFNYLVGDLTIRGETHEVELDVEFQGMARSPWGTMSAGFSAWTTLNRKEQFTKRLNQQGNLCNTGGMDVETSIPPVLLYVEPSEPVIRRYS